MLLIKEQRELIEKSDDGVKEAKSLLQNNTLFAQYAIPAYDYTTLHIHRV